MHDAPSPLRGAADDENAAYCAIAVMAKAPRPGRCKTRLTPPLAPDQAAALSAAFLRDTTENIVTAGHAQKIHPWAAYAPAGSEHLFDGHLADGTRLVLADGSPDMPPQVQGFGRSLLHAIQALLKRGYGAACVLNSDGPTLPTAYLAEAARLLAQPGDRAVLGPANDGGYYLLGLRQAHAQMFADIVWSTEFVAAQTIARAGEIGLEVVTLPVWYDVDDAAALQRLVADLSSQPGAGAHFAAPATRACLHRLGLLAATAPP